MYGGMSYKLSILRKKSGGADVTPNAVNWSDITGLGSAQNTNQTIAGIDTSITLRLDRSTILIGNGTAQYSKNNGAETTFASGDTISMSNNDTLYFKVNNTTFSPITGTVAVVNTSDSNALLDTFTWNVEPL